MTDLSILSWRDEEFLIRDNGLDPGNVLEYFYLSPFYSESGGRYSINESIRRGLIDPINVPRIEGEIYTVTGTGKDNTVTETSVYVITKVKQFSNKPKIHLENFYIISGNISKSPNFGKLINTILSNSLQELNNIFDHIQNSIDTQ
jgi:hypothetical protein